LIFCVFLVKFKIAVLFVLLAANLILINKFYKFLRKTIKIEKIIKNSKLDILNKILKYKVKKEF